MSWGDGLFQSNPPHQPSKARSGELVADLITDFPSQSLRN